MAIIIIETLHFLNIFIKTKTSFVLRYKQGL
jgi:hypothetical protein